MLVPEPIRATLMKNVVRRLTDPRLKIRAEIEVNCYTYHGIDAIKEALRSGENLGTSESPIKVRHVRVFMND